MVPQISDGIAVHMQKVCGQTDGVMHSDGLSQDRMP